MFEGFIRKKLRGRPGLPRGRRRDAPAPATGTRVSKVKLL